MPFQSEKQRRYLWANEPKIARDWADTYGSRIKKDDGGIMRVGLKKGSDRGGHEKTAKAGKSYERATQPGGEGAGAWQERALQTHRTEQRKAGKGAQQRAAEREAKAFKKQQTFKGGKFKQTTSNFRKNELKKLFDYIQGGRKFQLPSFSSVLRKADWDDEDYLNWNPKGASLHGDMSEKDLTKLQDIQTALGQSNLSQTAKFKGDEKFAFEDFYPNMNPPPQGGDGQGGGYMGYPSYEAWKAAQGGGGGGGGGATVPPVDTPSEFQQSLTTNAGTPGYYVGNDPTASNIAWGKEFGADPRTMGMTSYAAHGGRIPAAFGGIMDSSTGRRAYGFGSFFKSIKKAAKKVFKSPIGRAALLGAGAYFGPMAFGQGAGFSQWGKVPFLRNAMQKKHIPTDQKTGWLRNIFSGGKGLADDQWNPWKIGIGAAAALPFFMGGEKEDDGPKFNYEAAKNKYADEIMRIKAGSLAGTLDTNKFVYYNEGGRARLSNGGDPLLREEYEKYVFEMKEMDLTPMTFEEFAAQARAGMYAGGQSTPSDYTMEDARKTSMQDKMGGITDVMKHADLYRQGDVGQMYAADGGRIGYAGGSGHPPLTVGERPTPKMTGPRALQTRMAGPQALQTPMPAPQPNQMGRGMPGGMNPMGRGMPGGMNPMGRGMPGGMNPMGGMHPMMNRPMMRGKPMMGGRKMAQEGGLMDLGGMEKDYRNDGGFVPLGGEEKADDVPARLSKNEFVFTADAVRGAGDGDIDKGAEIMENIMKNLEQGGQISEETQGLSGAQEMFGVSERLSEVV